MVRDYRIKLTKIMCSTFIVILAFLSTLEGILYVKSDYVVMFLFCIWLGVIFALLAIASVDEDTDN